jgi:hypothetical protein
MSGCDDPACRLCTVIARLPQPKSGVEVLALREMKNAARDGQGKLKGGDNLAFKPRKRAGARRVAPSAWAGPMSLASAPEPVTPDGDGRTLRVGQPLEASAREIEDWTQIGRRRNKIQRPSKTRGAEKASSADNEFFHIMGAVGEGFILKALGMSRPPKLLDYVDYDIDIPERGIEVKCGGPWEKKENFAYQNRRAVVYVVVKWRSDNRCCGRITHIATGAEILQLATEPDGTRGKWLERPGSSTLNWLIPLIPLDSARSLHSTVQNGVLQNTMRPPCTAP